jgi:hypothetical protein
MPHPFLRLVHTLERRAKSSSFRAHVSLVEEGGRVLVERHLEESAPVALVVGTGDRIDVAGPSTLLPRHLAILLIPSPDGVAIRAVSLHPEKLFTMLAPDGNLVSLGGVEAHGHITISFDGLTLSLDAIPNSNSVPPFETAIVSMQAPGEQLAFHNRSTTKQVGGVVASIGGPDGGGHAIPALVVVDPEPMSAGTLVLRARNAVHRVEPSYADLTRGLLIGRSRRCVLGRGFDENDGLSRLHGLVIMLYDGVWVFDLASRYGLRDVARPTRVIRASRLDNGAGCLVYGAGHLVFEP